MRREARAAERLIQTLSLEPPVDIRDLAEKFADVEYDRIPTRCDGLVVGLRKAKPLILVEASQHPTRQRFTLAHELAHILLPWHVGNFACNTGGTRIDLWRANDDEPEANRFAAELLVPSGWLDRLIHARGDEKVGPLVEEILKAGVSTWVACLRLVDRLPAGHVYAVLDSSENVILSGQTKLTGIDPPKKGEKLERTRLDAFASEAEEVALASRRIVWWTFRRRPGELTVPPGDSRDLLRELARRHATPGEPAQRIVQRCGGTIGYAKDLAYREGETDRASLHARFRGRFAKTRDLPPALLADPDFETWLQMRAAELGDGPESRP